MEANTRAVTMSGAVLVFGSPSSNLQATKAILAEASRRGIAPDHIICTGNIVGCCGDAPATIETIRTSDIHVVAGDCDQQLGSYPDARGSGFPDSPAWYTLADKQISTAQRQWLAGLPTRIDIEVGKLRFAVVHAALAQNDRMIFASTPALAKKRDLEAAALDGIVAGHCGLPFTQALDGRVWHNPGAVGMPAHDGTPRVWYSVIRPVGDGIEIEHAALDYDHAGAQAAMRQAGMPTAYEVALETGLWPEVDALPQREIQAAGIPFEAGRLVWQPDAAARAKRRGSPITERLLWPTGPRDSRKQLAPEKFKHPGVTAKGEQRARVPLKSLDTLWFNTGTQCNITCRNCYIESSPKNDRLVYLTLDDVRGYLDEIERDRLPTREIAFTGGEPFLNPAMLAILEECLARGFQVLVLTNAMKPMQRHKKALLDLKARYPDRLVFRVSLDHFNPDRHEEERGIDTFRPAMQGLRWLSDNGFSIAVAGRTMWGENEAICRAGFTSLFATEGIAIDAADRAALVLFPEMDEHLDVPEITTACWDILHKSPNDMMCSTSRMVVKRKGAESPAVLACTLLAYDPQFELGATLKEASRAVPLNHAHCAKFCVLGGASCSPSSPDTQAPDAIPSCTVDAPVHASEGLVALDR